MLVRKLIFDGFACHFTACKFMIYTPRRLLHQTISNTYLLTTIIKGRNKFKFSNKYMLLHCGAESNKVSDAFKSYDFCTDCAVLLMYVEKEPMLPCLLLAFV